MHTSIALVALVAATTEAPPWLKTDYAVARRQGAQNKKPLVVLLGSGKTGWNRVVQGSEVSREVEKLLKEHYVCVHVDTSTEAGKDLARQIKVPDGVGVVISDRSGDYQAFRHQGTLSNNDLDSYLRRYSDPDRVVTQTETSSSRRASFSVNPEFANPPSFSTYPTFPTYQSSPTYSGSYCPS